MPKEEPMAEQFDFEKSMQRLEEIVEKLEKGNLPLRDSLKLFEEGTKLSRLCTKRLEEAEKRVEILLQGDDGVKKAEPFAMDQPDLFSEAQSES